MSTVGFMSRHPAHWIAMGLGSGLSPVAPGTVGTLWAWAAFIVGSLWLDEQDWMLVIALGLLVGWWACTRAAQHLAAADPSCIVWDEVIAFWIVLLLATPATLLEQCSLFGLFRFFDIAKPGPVAWADALYKQREGQALGWAQGWGILFDDLVAALCTLLLWAAWKF